VRCKGWQISNFFISFIRTSQKSSCVSYISLLFGLMLFSHTSLVFVTGFFACARVITMCMHQCPCHRCFRLSKSVGFNQHCWICSQQH